MTQALIDETATAPPSPSTNIERDRERALQQYKEGIIGFYAYSAWMERLDYQQRDSEREYRERVRKMIDDSLADAPWVAADEGLMRDDERYAQPRRHDTPLVGKFVRGL